MFAVEGILRDSYDGDDAVTLDLQEGYIVPPYGDAHDHGLADPGFDRDSGRFLAQGIFYVSNPNSILRWTQEARAKAARVETVDVRYANGGLTCSGGHPIQIYDGLAAQSDEWTAEEMAGQAYFIVDGPEQLEQRWQEILAGEPDFLKIMLEHAEEHAERRDDAAFYGKRGLDPALVSPIVAKAHAAGLPVSAHVTTAFDFRTAVEAGVDEIAHLPLERLAVADAQLAAERRTVVVTTSLSHRPTPGVADVDGLHRHNLRLLREHGVRLVLGTDSHLSVVDEAENLHRLGAFGAADLLALLTRETPRWIFPERRIGLLQEGYEASFLALEKNPLQELAALRQITVRVKKGHVLEVAEEESRPSIGQALGHTVMREGAQAAIAEYRRLRAEEPEGYDFSEPQLNALGYALLQHQRYDDAIAIFLLNVEMFPKSFNVYDSLGEAYMLRGDRALAIQNYRRSLELNPHNQNAVEKLGELE